MSSENGAEIADAITRYECERLLLVSSDEKTTITIDEDSEQIEIRDIQKEDEIDFYFSVSDTDGRLHNEVYLRVMITFTVRLEMICGEKRKRTGFSAGEDYFSSSTAPGSRVDISVQRRNGFGRRNRLPP